jgi:hypothetical protein
MTTDDPRDPPRLRPPSEPQPAPRPNGASTESTSPQKGALIEELGRLTRRLPGARTAQQRVAGPRAPAPSRERIAALVAALGNPDSPQHVGAVDELALIGPPAVPALCAALDAGGPWLAAYRASEALLAIGDGRAAGPLSQALNHPNSNVRWGAVRALAEIGDARTVLLLRRVAQDDRGKTSWGESVSGAAQSALDQIRDQSPWGQGIELAKTAVTCVIMIVALVLAFSVIGTLREELGRISTGASASGALVRPAPLLSTAPAPTTPPTPSPAPTDAPAPAAALDATQGTPESAPTPLPGGSEVITGSVTQAANVRSIPSSAQNVPIGRLAADDEVIFLTITPDGQWYKVRLGERHAEDSLIGSADGVGWISRSLVTPPNGIVPIEEVVLPTATPTT